MRIGVVTILVASLALCACTGGQRGLWCANYSTGLNDCSFYSFEQCRASIVGAGGSLHSQSDGKAALTSLNQRH